jgi:hypothetical protein
LRDKFAAGFSFFISFVDIEMRQNSSTVYSQTWRVGKIQPFENGDALP